MEGGKKKRGNKNLPCNEVIACFKWLVDGKLHMCPPEQKKNALVFSITGGISSHTVDETLNTGMTLCGWQAAQWLQLMCSFHSRVHGALMACSQIFVCGGFFCGNNDTHTHRRTHTLGVSGLHLCGMTLGGQSQQTDVSALLKKMPTSPRGCEKAMNKFITLMYWP